MPIRLALIGCGYIAQASHGPALARLASEGLDIELTACCDTSLERAEELCTQTGFRRAYSDYRHMLDAERPNAVALLVPVHLTAPLAAQILQLGYPLLAEKPPALTVTDLDALIQAAAATRTFHMVAFNRRFAPLITELKSLLVGKTILHVEHTFTRVGRTDPDFSTTAIHGIDSLRWLLGTDFRSLEFRYRELQEDSKPVTVFSAQGSFNNDAGVHLLFHPLSGAPAERTTIYTPHETFDLRLNQGPDAPGSLAHWQDGKLIRQIDAAQRCGSSEDFVLSGFYAENAAFLQAVKSGLRRSEHDFTSARQSVEIMQSMRERRANYQIQQY